MSSLEDRLKALRQAHGGGSSSSSAAAASPIAPAPLTHSSSSDDEDDDEQIAYLIAATKDEVDLEYAAQCDADYLGPASESSDSASLDSLDEAAAAGCFDIRAEADALSQEASKWSASAEKALGELPASVLVPQGQEAGPSQDPGQRTEGQAAQQPHQGKLERLARPAPVLVRAPSSAALREDSQASAKPDVMDEDLASELAAAMADEDESRGSSVKDLAGSMEQPGTSSRTAEAPSKPEADVRDLSQRFAALRTRITAPLAAAAPPKAAQPPPAAPSAPLFPSPPSALPDFPSLPSAPRDPPPDPRSDDLKARHGIDPDRNLGAFERLVRLDAKRLEEPGTRKAPVGGMASEESDEEEDGPDSWCCEIKLRCVLIEPRTLAHSSFIPGICNENATLLCIGCDADLYCSECWAEGHGRMGRDEIREHRTKPFESRRARRKRDGGGAASGPPSRRAMAA